MKRKSIAAIFTACLAAGAVLMTAACSGGGNDSSQTGNTGTTTPFTTPFGTNSTVTQQSDQTSTVIPTVSQASQTVPVVSQPSTVIPQTSVAPQGNPNAAMAGTYGIQFSAEAQATLSQLTAEQQQLLLNSTMTLNADGSLMVSMAGQTGSGSWWDNGDGTITLVINGEQFTYTYSNGIISDPSDMTSYFQKR